MLAIRMGLSRSGQAVVRAREAKCCTKQATKEVGPESPC